MHPVRVAVTGGAGNISYSLLFCIASGGMFGKDQPVILQLLEIPPAMKALEGVVMELEDGAYPLVKDIRISDSADNAFDGADWALLVGAKPRGKGMERSDLLMDNGKIFVAQGKALTKASSDIRILVVGNPCNTNALIAKSNADGIPGERFMAMTMLDQNRAVAQLAKKAGVLTTEVSNMTIWGNHSSTQFPDFEHAKIGGRAVTDVITNRNWLENDFISTVQKRGAAIIEARGASSAASAANAIVGSVRSLITPTPTGEWFSGAVLSDGSYGVPEGIMSSFPLTSTGQGDWSIVQGLELSDYARGMIDASAAELVSEREMVSDLLSD